MAELIDIHTALQATAPADGIVVAMFCRGPLERFPPALVVAQVLADMASRILIVCDESNPATVAGLPSNVTVIAMRGFHGYKASMLTKAMAARRYRSLAWQLVARHSPRILWVVNPHTAIVLGPKLKNSAFVLHLLELEEGQVIKQVMARYVRWASAVVVAEATRAAVTRVWYRLEQTPFVLPNRTVPANLHLDIHPAEEQLRGKKVVLYQGIIRKDRDIRPIARTVSRMGSPWVFAVMGLDFGFEAELRRTCPDILWIPFIPAPMHLAITRHARIGVVTYDFDCLNNIFCAPNKIYEYAAFSVPMIGNDVPGLLSTVQLSGAGVCCDFSRDDLVALALQEIEGNHEEFSKRTAHLLRMNEPSEIIGSVLETVSGR